MKVIGLVSGGKDCTYNLMKCLEMGDKIICLVNLYPSMDSGDEIDSFMYQSVAHNAVQVCIYTVDVIQ